MRRRDAVLALAASLAVPHAAYAQSPKPPPRVAVIFLGTPETDKDVREAFEQAMREYGYADGKNVILDLLWRCSSMRPIPSWQANEQVQRGAHAQPCA